MSQLQPGQEIKYRIFKAKITGCTSPFPTPWYKDRVGETIAVRENSWYQDGKLDHISYSAETGGGYGFNGSIQKEDFKEQP